SRHHGRRRDVRALPDQLADLYIDRQVRASAPGCLVYLTSFRCSHARAAEARLLGSDGCLEIARLGPELARLMAGSDYPTAGSRGPAD
ncbi:MAG TPA: hypothetical protein VIO84_08530, partial [Candidatus Dormibacteraeota bacterium]